MQNIFLHQHWSESYHVTLDSKRKTEPFIRSFEEKLVFLKGLGFKHVSNKKSPNEKMISICRDFSLATVALCREAKIPARARCGFSAFFENGKYIDHWVAEYWNKEENKWIMVDAQLDELQSKALKISFNPLSVDKDSFITGDRAWLLAREGKIDDQLFGIFNSWGYKYLICNLLLDTNSLLGTAMQPWDMWEGYKSLPLDKFSNEDYKILDELAGLIINIDNDFDTFHKFVLEHGKIQVPKDLNKVTNSLLI